MRHFFLRTLQRGVKTNLFSLAGYKGEQENNFKCKEHLGLILKYTSTGFALYIFCRLIARKIILISLRPEKK